MPSPPQRSAGIVAALGALATVFIVLTGIDLFGGYHDVARQLARPAPSGQAKIPSTVRPATPTSSSRPAPPPRGSRGGADAELSNCSIGSRS